MQEIRKELREERQQVQRFLSNSTVRNYYITLIATALATWTLAFNYGAYNTVFFRSLLAIWVLSSVVFLGTIILPKHERPLGTAQLIGLLLPTLWVVSFFISPDRLGESNYQIIDTIITFITMLSLPNLGYAILIITQGETLRLPLRMIFAMVLIVIAVFVAGFWMGANHPRFLTCQEFTVAGDFAPENCSVEP